MSILRRIRALASRASVEREIQDELQSHIEMRMADNIQAGMTHDEARRDALRRFGNPTLMKEKVVAEDAALTLESLIADVRYGLRQLSRNRGFAVTAILTLALGIGATTAIFSILNTWILQPLPLEHPDRLVELWRATPAGPNEPAFFFSWRDYLSFGELSHSFESLGASFERGYALTGDGKPESVGGAVASRTLFSTLGVAAFRGRLFLPEDETSGPVAVISYSLWTKRFHRSLGALGQILTLNDKPFKVIGVLPSTFSYRVLDQPKDADVWTLIQAGDPEYKQDSTAAVALIGRLKPEVSISQARSEIALLESENERRHPDVAKSTALLVGLQQDNTRTVRSSLLVLGGAVGLLLLIACTNTASLIVGRNIQREKEFAVRAAMGSSAHRLLAQLLVENLILYGISGALGLLIAFGAVRGFINWNPFGVLPSQPIAVNVPVLIVAAVLTVFSGLLFGAYPAFRAAKVNLNRALRSSGTGASPGASALRSRNIIVITQIALSVMLLIGASLLLTTFLRLNAQPLGFDVKDTHVLNLSLPNRRYASNDELTQFADRLLDRLRTLPGVNAAGMTLFLRLADAGTAPFQIDSQRQVTEEHLPHAVPVTVGPSYFQAMGIPTIQGRDFDNSDGQNTVPVTLINQEAAHQYFGDKSPIGEHVRIGDPKDAETQKNPWLEVVGVVGSTKSVRYNQIAWEARPEVYTDYRQQQIHPNAKSADYTNMSFVLRTSPGVSLDAATIQKAVWHEDPNLPVGEIKSLGDMVASLQTQPRVRARLLTIFGVLTLLLAAIGIYGVMAQSVTQRYREIGIRMALGADRSNVLLLVLKQGFRLTVAGVFFGTVFGLVVVRLMKSLLYGITSNGLITYALVIAVVAFVAVLASLLPAKRAASVDPVRSLRTE